MAKLRMDMYGGLVESQNPAHWNMIGRSITAPLPVLHASSVFHQRKNSFRLYKIFHFDFIYRTD
jgi:hypothetical protein